MSAQVDAIATLLAADATLVATLTGGIHKFGSLENGITRDSLPSSAFDSDIYLKPIAAIVARSENRFGGAYDHGARYKSVRDVVEIYVCKDPSGGIAAIDTAANRIEFLLDGVFIGTSATLGGGWTEIINRIDEGTIPALNNAKFHRLDFGIVRGKYLT